MIATACSTPLRVGFLPPVGTSLAGLISSWKRIVVAVSAPSRARTAARYSFVRMTKRPSAALPLALHQLDQQPVGAHRPLGLATGDEEVRMVEVDRVDLVEVDERLDLDRPGLARLDRGELLVAEHDLLAVEVVAVADLLPEHLLVLLRAEAPLLDPSLVLRVQLVEVVVEVAGGADQLHRDIDQAEAQRAAPERARHS